MARKPKCWIWRTGTRGNTVTAYERQPGGLIYLRVALPEGGWNRKCLGHSDREEAQKAAESLRDTRRAGDKQPRRLTVAALWDIYTRSVDGKQSDVHSGDTLRAAELWTRFLGSNYEIRKFGIAEWESFSRLRASGELDSHGHRITDPDKREPVGPRVVAKDLKALRAACIRATAERTPAGTFRLDADPTRGLELPEEKNPLRPIYTGDRVDALMAVAPQVQMRIGYGKAAHWEKSYLPMLCRLAHDTGRRISSILALQWPDWHPEMGTNGKLYWSAASDKVGRDWFSPVTKEVREELEAYRRERMAVGAVLMFPAPNNAAQPVDVQVASDWLKRAEKLAGLEHLPHGAWHCYRRKWATERKHLSPKDVAEVGGWVETSTLQKVYQAPDDETMELVVSQPKRLRRLG